MTEGKARAVPAPGLRAYGLEPATQSQPEALVPSREIIETHVLADWLDRVASGRWSWVRNTRCKYVTLGIDTRRGAYRVEDRDGKPLTAGELLWQYSRDTPRPPITIADEIAGALMWCIGQAESIMQLSACEAPAPAAIAAINSMASDIAINLEMLAQVGTRPTGPKPLAGSVRSTSDAVTEGHAPTPSSPKAGAQTPPPTPSSHKHQEQGS